MSSKRMKYSAKLKLQVVKFAQESNNCAAGREFCVNEKLVRNWRKQVEKLKCMPQNKCSNCGKPCQWPELEDKLLCWIEEQRQSGYIVSRNMIIIKAKAMAAELQIIGFQLLVYKLPSPEEPCSLTEDENRTKAPRRSRPEDHKLPQLRYQPQKEGKLRTCSHREHGRNSCLV